MSSAAASRAGQAASAGASGNGGGAGQAGSGSGPGSSGPGSSGQAGAGGSPPDGSGLDSRRRFKLLEECREVILDKLSGIVTRALDKMAEELTSEALKVTRSDRQRTLLDAVMLVREQRRSIEQSFRRYFGDVFERRLFAPQQVEAPAGEAADVSSDDMQLVSEEAIADKIDVDRLIHRARSRLDPEEVLGIRARLGALLEREWFDEASHPASPEAVFEALRTAINEIAPSPTVRNALIDAFEPHVTTNLNAVYTSINARLKAQQVLPRIRQRVARDARAAAPGQPGGAGQAAAGQASPGGQPGTAADGASASALMQLGQAGTIAMSASGLAALQQALSRGTAGGAGARGDAARMLSDPGMFGMADLPVEQVQEPLLEALTEVQRDSHAQDSRMVMELLPLLLEKVKESGTPLDQMTVELVSVVFDYIYADKSLADTVKHQLLRLQVIAVKAALLDRSFFARRQHPMRQLVDRITQLAADPDADLAADAPLVAGLAKVIDQLVAEFDQDLSSFLVAIDRIDELSQQESARRGELIAAQLKAAEREEAYSLALEVARRELASRVDDGTPLFVREFLLRWWTPVIARSSVDAVVKEGEEAPQSKALRIAEFLIWSVLPKHPEEIGRLAALLPKLIRAINEGAKVVEVPKVERDAFLQELLEAHAAIIDTAKGWQVGQPDPRPSDVRLRSDGSVRFSRQRRARFDDAVTIAAGDAALESLERGDRIEVVDDAGARLVYKLAWISPARKLFILSRYPKETLTFSAADLASLVFNEKARRVEDPQAVDHAIGALAKEGSFPAPER